MLVTKPKKVLPRFYTIWKNVYHSVPTQRMVGCTSKSHIFHLYHHVAAFSTWAEFHFLNANGSCKDTWQCTNYSCLRSETPPTCRMLQLNNTSGKCDNLTCKLTCKHINASSFVAPTTFDAGCCLPHTFWPRLVHPAAQFVCNNSPTSPHDCVLDQR